MNNLDGMLKIGLMGIFIFLIFNLDVVSALEATVCCERTTNGAFCQNVPSEACAEGARQVPTSCESTSYCKPGVCYDSNEGTCLDNTPQLVCNNNGGIWSEESPAQCNLGCCVLGDQAAFVSLVRCKKLSASLGLNTIYDKSIGNELACIASVQQQDKGACVYESEFQKTCKFITRAECNGVTSDTNVNRSLNTRGVFYEGKLCSAEELGTNCGPSSKTSCLAGKDEVYFLDTCGNVANIYDSSKVRDKEYWTNVKTKAESCNVNGANALSSSCGNCNYLLGSYCRSSNVVDKRASYGDYICANLNCKDESGKARKHGESWCLANERRGSDDDVGSRFFRRICMNGQVVTEPCDDLRAQECIQDTIVNAGVEFSQAACRVNRWQECLAQADELDCENTDRRDCEWREGIELGNKTRGGLCLPKTSPGLAFWNSEESLVVCGAGNKQCIVKFEKGLFGGESCVENCECLEKGWENKYAGVCSALGDCGSKVNYEGKRGFKEGIKVLINGKPKEDK